MVKYLECKNFMPDCDAVVEAETEEELMKKAAEHAAEVHGIAQIPDLMIASIKACMKER